MIQGVGESLQKMDWDPHVFFLPLLFTLHYSIIVFYSHENSNLIPFYVSPNLELTFQAHVKI